MAKCIYQNCLCFTSPTSTSAQDIYGTIVNSFRFYLSDNIFNGTSKTVRCREMASDWNGKG
jgi:hypothetical protein